MSELSDSTQQSVAGKRSASPDPGRASPPSKAARAAGGSGALVPGCHDVKNSDTAGRTETKESGKSPTHGENGSAPITTRNTTALPESGDAYPSTSSSSGVGPCTSSSSSGDAHPQTLSEAGNGSAGVRAPCHSPPPEQSDWAAIAAAEALASLTRSSSFPSEEEAEDAECAIVSVKMAAETRQSVASLAQVQVRLEALERKSARLHQRLELKLSQQRRPHLEQRSAIIRTIPGFWVTALLNHPLLSAHIDESDEEALSSMSHLEVESLKNTRMGYRISFHFNCNSYFQNTTIFKEFHLGLGGSMASFSSPILWHRGQDLTSQGASGKESGSFFCWFSDHSEPGHDQIAQILKEDLYRNPLRYYLTPLWEPRENGSGHRGMDHSSGNECVVISDSEEDEDEGGARRDEEEDADTGSGDSEDGEQHDDDSSDREEEEEDEEEELDVEELDEEQESSSPEVKGQEEEEEEEGGAGVEPGTEHLNMLMRIANKPF
ncbi:hypothetical protein ANANG_G00217530 [Anguilla anguilla]|uniref:Testis specific protein Y-linked n=1 Tax=Anguilla anguilla TaxID=7936 RepID=A0A9D3LX81_ANGAN|nr:hypothetical protein ANANG_G00217530 [Anguilla anguilla]